MKNGFTLVELAIVLVIIGLLIGGILVAQSLVDSAKINREIRNLTQYSIAFVNFRQKFNQEAGDSDLFSSPGNNNGNTGETSGSCPNRIEEGASAWAHLSEAKMLSEQYSYPTPGWGCSGHILEGTGPTYDIEIENSTDLITYSAEADGRSYGGKTYYRRLFAVYDIYETLAIENKLDDGIPSITDGTIYASTGYDESVCTIANAVSEGVSYGYDDPMFCNFYIYFSPSWETPLLP